MGKGASVPDQALVASDGAPAGLHPSGFDPVRVADALCVLSNNAAQHAAAARWWQIIWKHQCRQGQRYLRLATEAIHDGALGDFTPCDSDGSPKGGDGLSGSVHDGAGRQASPTP